MPETVQFLKNAPDTAAFTVAVTCHPKSVLAGAADETLMMARLQESGYGGPITDVPLAVILAEALALAVEARSRKSKRNGFVEYNSSIL